MTGLQRLAAIFAAIIFACAIAGQNSASAQVAQVFNAEQCFQATTGINGMVGSLGTITGGSGGTAGIYTNVPLTGGSGTGATANITVSGGAVTTAVILSPGINYVVGGVLSAATGNIGNVSGFSVPINSISINSSLAGGTVGMFIPNTLTPSQTWQDPNQVTQNTNPIRLDANGCAIIYGTGSYRQILEDSLGNVVWDRVTSIGVASSAQYQVSTTAAMQAISTTSALTYGVIQRNGYYAVGDSPTVVYSWSTTPCSLNSGAGDGGGQIPPASGTGCWLLANQATFDIRDWGCVNDWNGTTGSDNATCLQNAINYVETTGWSRQGGTTGPVLSGAGLTYGMGSNGGTGIVISPTNGTFALRDIYLISLSTATYTDSCYSLYTYGQNDLNCASPPPGMINVTGVKTATMQNVTIDGNNVAGTTGVVLQQGYNIYAMTVIGATDFEVYLGLGATGFCLQCEAKQFSPQNVAGQTAYGIYAAQSFDNYWIQSQTQFSKVPLYVDRASSDFNFLDGHCFNGSDSTKGATNAYLPICVVDNAVSTVVGNNGVSLAGSTIDNSQIVLTIDSDGGTTGTVPALSMTGTKFEYQGDRTWALDAWVAVITDNAASGDISTFTNNGAVSVQGVYWGRSNKSGIAVQLNNIILKTKGSGTWNPISYMQAATINGQPAVPGYAPLILPLATIPLSVTETLGSPWVSYVAANDPGWMIGDHITGTGIPANSYIFDRYTTPGTSPNPTFYYEIGKAGAPINATGSSGVQTVTSDQCNRYLTPQDNAEVMSFENGSSTCTVSVNNTLPPGWTIAIYPEGAGGGTPVSIAPLSGATLNGGGSPGTLGQNIGYIGFVERNGGSASGVAGAANLSMK